MPIDLASTRRRFAADLFADFLPFVRDHVIDPTYGGFCCWVRPDGTRVSDLRDTWYEGRGVWVYSHLYGTLDRDPRYLDVAARTLALLARTRPSGAPSGRPKTLHLDGSAAGPPDPEVYSDLFVAEGLAAFARAAGDDARWHEAAEIVRHCRRRLDDPPYEADLAHVATAAGVPLVPPPHPGVRPLGVWMLLVRVLSELLAARPDAALAAELRAAVDVVLTRHLSPRYRLLAEVLAPDLTPGSGPAPGFCYLGHAVETLWMVAEAARQLGDVGAFDTATALLRRHLEVARDTVFGGFFRALVDVDAAVVTLDKTLWVQEEALNAALLLATECGDPWAFELFAELDGYLHTTFPLRSIGSPLWREDTDRTGTTLQRRPRVENYHHPRMLMRTIATLDRLGRPEPGTDQLPTRRPTASRTTASAPGASRPGSA